MFSPPLKTLGSEEREGDRGCWMNSFCCSADSSVSFQAAGPQSLRHYLWLAWPDHGDTLGLLFGGNSGFLLSQSGLSSFPTRKPTLPFPWGWAP